MRKLLFTVCSIVMITAANAGTSLPGYKPGTPISTYLKSHPGTVFTNSYNSQNQAIGGLMYNGTSIVTVKIDPATGAIIK